MGTTAILTPKKLFTLTKPVQLVVTGTPPSGLQDTLDRYLDGGQNAIAILSKKSATITSQSVSERTASRPSGPLSQHRRR